MSVFAVDIYTNIHNQSFCVNYVDKKTNFQSWSVSKVGFGTLWVVESPVSDGSTGWANSQAATIEEVTTAISVFGSLVYQLKQKRMLII